MGYEGLVSNVYSMPENETQENWKGVTYLDLTKTQRAQIPNVSDSELRGYFAGFGCKLF